MAALNEAFAARFLQLVGCAVDFECMWGAPFCGSRSLEVCGGVEWDGSGLVVVLGVSGGVHGTQLRRAFRMSLLEAVDKHLCAVLPPVSVNASRT